MGLTRKGFEAWLRGKEKNEVVGRRNKERSCPLACYLHEQGYPLAEVGGITYSLDGSGAGAIIIPLRKWAARFVTYVDGATCVSHPFNIKADVTAEEARAVLRRV